MVYSEATLALPLIAGYAYHKRAHAARQSRHWSRVLILLPRSQSLLRMQK